MAQYHDSKHLARILGVSEREFHSQIKKQIVRDFYIELSEIGLRNPDILLDEENLIFLAHPQNHRVPPPIATNIDIFSYI